MKLHFLLALSFSISAMAKEAPKSDATFLSQCAQSKDCELSLIYEIAKTYRPATEEDELRNYILQIKKVSEQNFWKKSLETFQDKIGNLMIRLPATGRFTATNSKYFALQSHMDMVLAYADAKPGENIKPYFKDGIKLEVKDGWLQSVGNKTSIGTDNSTGVAYSLRYLIDPTIEHPPLELIFTVQEEIGLIGAYNSELPIKSKKMICLDGMTPEPGYIIAGSQGASANQIKFDSFMSSITKKELNKVIDVTVTKLAGGHSGGDIHRKRGNGIIIFANLVKFISSQVGGEVTIKNVVIGDVGVMNKIPNLFNAQLVIPANKPTLNLKEKIESYLKDVIAKNPDDAAKADVKVVIDSGKEREYLTTDSEFTNYLVKAFTSAPNGVIDYDAKYGVAGTKNSNNLSFFELKPSEDKMNFYKGNFGFMARGFDQERVIQIKERINTIFNKPHFVNNFSSKVSMEIAPWMEPEDSTLLQTVMSIPEFSKKFYLAGGLEPSAFKLKIPGLEVVALGPYQQMAHSVNEKLKISTLYPTGQNILRIIQAQ